MRGLMKQFIILMVISFVFLLAACRTDEEATTEENEGKVNIVTTIAQIGEPLSVIGGEHVEVDSLMGPAVDPHLYNATHSDITRIDEAELVFYNGLNLEANMIDIFNEMSDSKPVVAIGETIPEDLLLEDEEEEGVPDPHIWFDLDLWQQALESAVQELKDYAPEHAEEFEENKVKYFAEMDELKESSSKLEKIPEQQRYLVTAHDAFGYFGQMHGLEVVGLQGLSTDGEIGVSDIQETIDILAEYQVPAVFVESSISENSIQAVIEGAESEGLDVSLGGELYSDAMGETGTEEGTYLGMYKHNVDTIYEALMKGVE